MVRRYYHARAVGRPEVVLQKISNVVLGADMASQIPLVKLERSAHREFYVFLGVDDDWSYGIPGGLGNVLSRVGIRFDELSELSPEHIASMVQRQDIEIYGFNSLTYRPWVYRDPGDPLAASVERFSTNEPDGSWATHERLLHWISSRGEGTWEHFKSDCEIIGVVDDWSDAGSVLRRFRLLGHIDVSPDGSNWSIAPSAFVRYPDNKSKGFLVGQRTEVLLDQVETVGGNVRTTQNHPVGPQLIELELSDADQLRNLNELGIMDAGVTACRLANLLPDLEGWKNSLEPIASLNPGRLEIERWDQGRFQSCDTLYVRDGVYFGQSGMYRFRSHDEQSRRSMTVFFDQTSQRWLKGDWYGLRFLHIVAGPCTAGAVHDLATGSLFIPTAKRWPLLYEQALTLASGLLPIPSGNRNWLEYRRVPIDIARILCQKLNVILVEE